MDHGRMPGFAARASSGRRCACRVGVRPQASSLIVPVLIAGTRFGMKSMGSKESAAVRAIFDKAEKT